VLWNLLSNAIKFTPPSGRVRVRLSRVGTTTELTVSDTGQGITAEFLPFVFGRFQQADASTTREHRGMGLGLSIVKNLVEMHGGSVTAQSEGEGRGATFTVRLPAIAAWRPSGPAAERLATVRPARPLSAAAALSGVRVLLVDDEPDARELVARVLREQGAAVECAGSVRDAVPAIERLLPDVLESDIGMAGEDGYGLIRALRARPRERGGAIPAIALTAFARPEDRAHALAAGYQAHLAKPLDAPALVAAVAELARAAVRGAGL
jgi:CheY-like chemotaxis protein